MALAMMLTGMVSGHIQERLHYPAFFLFVLLASIPPIVIAWFAPFVHDKETAADSAAA
jgi:MFS transporter, PAT family, beta-lactamase induction signal transducer AmpG